MSSLRRLILESGKYAAAAVLALASDMAILWFLVNVLGWNYLIATTVGFVLGGVLLYVLCVTFVFGSRRVANRAVELPSFVALGLIGLAVNLMAIRFGVDGLRLNLVHAKLFASGCSFGVNFALRRVLLFSPATTRTQETGT